MVNYGNGKIYKIVSSNTEKVYIGSTTKKYLSQRMDEHRSAFKSNKARKCKSEELLKEDDAQIILLENYPCSSKDELLARERHWYDQYKNVAINKVRPVVSNKERQIQNNEKAKTYRENNREKINTKARETGKKNWAVRYAKEKDKILERQKIKTVCECGSEVRKVDISKHIKTKKHITFQENKI